MSQVPLQTERSDCPHLCSGAAENPMSYPPDDSNSPPGSSQAFPMSQQSASALESASARRMTLGERIRIARYAAHLTQEELAGSTFSKSYISAVERGKMTPSIAALRLLTERLSVSVAYLLGEQESDPNMPPGQEPAPNANLSSDEQLLTQQFEEAEQLLMNHAPTAALERLGNPETEARLPPQHQARWAWLYGWARLQLHHEQEAIAVLQHGLEAAQATHDLRSEGHLHYTLAKAHLDQEKRTGVDQLFQAAIRCFEQTSDYHALLCVYDTYSDFLAQQGRYQEAYEQMQRAQAAAAHLRGERAGKEPGANL